LQGGNWRTLNIRAVFATDSRATAITIEAAALTRFRSDSLGGEWLSISPDVLILFIEEAFGDGSN
jgi:hypothetical protein